MKPTPRRRVLITAVALAVMAPLELLLLQAWSTPDATQAIRQYVAGLDTMELTNAADRIVEYPFAYRLEIMRALPLERRESVWRAHIARYLDARPGLDANARNVLETAQTLLTRGVLGQATAADRAQLVLIAEQTVQLLGREDAEYLFYRLGPRDGKFTSLEPWHMKFGNWVRSVAVAVAGDADDCNCHSGFGCSSENTFCRTEGLTCTLDEEWPACGWFWNQTCDGMCSIIMPSGGL